jgi:hypothetical protein
MVFSLLGKGRARQRRPVVAHSVLVALLAVACSGRSRRSDDGVRAAGGESGVAGRGGAAGGAGAGAGGAVGKGGAPGSSGEAGGGPLSDAQCRDRLAAIDRSCSADTDCALGAWKRCTLYDHSEIVGIAAGALGELAALAGECGRPVEDADCPGEGGGVSPQRTEDGVGPGRDPHTAAVACVAGRCTSYATRCGRDLCENGTIDRCIVTEGTTPRFERTEDPEAVSEPCDGDLFGELSCGFYGYASGQLQCSDGCLVDTSACDPCGELTGGLVDCRTGATGDLGWFAAAASDSELAVLFKREDGLHLSRFAPDLTLLGDALFSAGEPNSWDTGALARAPGAWVFVMTRVFPAGYDLFVLPDGGTVEAGAQKEGEIRNVLLLSRPAESPLLVYTIVDEQVVERAQALTVTDDLRRFGSVRELAPGRVTDGLWVGDGYLLTRVLDGQSDLLRLDADPLVPPSAVPLPLARSDFFDHPRIGSAGETAFVLSVSGGASMIQVDARGAAIDPTVAYGLLGSPSAPVVTSAGVFVATEFAFIESPATGIRLVGGTSGAWIEGNVFASPAELPFATPFGDDIVVVFQNERGFGLARWNPTLVSN